MSTLYIDGKPHTLLASARLAAPQFRHRPLTLIGVDYQDYTGGGMSNVRFTREQAMALRDVLHRVLTDDTASRVEIAKAEDGLLAQKIERTSGKHEVGRPAPEPRFGYKLNVEMTYDDYSPHSQTTPSRLENLVFATHDQLLEAQDLIESLCERHRKKVENFFTTYEELKQVVMDDDEYDAVADARELFYEMAENYEVKQRKKKPKAHA